METKQAIHFDEYGFEIAFRAFKDKVELEKAIVAKVKTLIGDFDFKAKDLFPNPETKIFQLVEAAYIDQNPMGLSGHKLAELKEINVSSLLNNEIHEYGKRINYNKPSKAEFTTYAETPEQNERLEACKKFIESYKTFLQEGQFVNQQMANHLYAATNGAINWGHNSTLIPNTAYVKGTL
tara:strand:- start:786 stop:1325 length:540 start_codon:yes stop_codon:yes gene_type:complete